LFDFLFSHYCYSAILISPLAAHDTGKFPQQPSFL
jgi:hypothetical protein